MKNIARFVLALPVILSACQPAPKREVVAETKKVKLVSVERKEIRFAVHTSGYLASSKEIKLAFKTGGIIGKINAGEGREVKQGEVLAILNLGEIEAQVQQARSVYEKTQRDFSRARNLYLDSVATLEQYQNAETALNMARSALEVAEFNLLHSRIIAPEQGTILRRFAEEGEMIAPGYPVFLFGTRGKHWKVKAGLSDRDFIKVNPGDSAFINMDTYPDKVFTATVSQLTEAANPMTGTYEVELDLEDTPLRLASGFVARVELYPSHTDAMCLVPVEALVEAEGDSAFVFTVTGESKAKKIRVQIAMIQGSMVAVSSGMEGISEVVTDGSAYLLDGDPVVVIHE